MSAADRCLPALTPRERLAFRHQPPDATGEIRPALPGSWLNCFDADYRAATTSRPSTVAPPDFQLCDAFWPIIEARIDDIRAFVGSPATESASFGIDFDRFIDSALPTLRRRLFAASSRALVVELAAAQTTGRLRGETAKDRFDFFVDCLRDPAFAAQILGQYPVLLRQVVTLSLDWRDVLIEFLGRLARDRQSLSRQLVDGDLRVLRSIDAGAGDPHRHGRSVIIAEFDDGDKVVYKPRSLAVDGNFARLVGWIDARLPDLHLAAGATIDRTTHGWATFIEAYPASTQSDVAAFYRRQGANLALTHLLGACDLHSENVIAAGDTPILIDLETLFHPRLDSSVLATGLLPHRSPASGNWADLSGMGNAEERELPCELPIWQEQGTDRMRMALSRPTTGVDRNLPILDGRRPTADAFVDDVVEGFRAIAGLVSRHRDALLAPDGAVAAFRGNAVRVVLRPTLYYALLLEESFHPSCLVDALAREACFDTLWREAEDDRLLARVVPAERRDLWRGDIPVFSTQTDSVDLWTSDGERIADALAISGYQAMAERIAQLDDQENERQCDVIRAALAEPQPLASSGNVSSGELSRQG